MGASVAVNDATFSATIEQSSGLSVVDFWAPWCGPCRVLGPLIEQLAAEYRGRATIAKLNVDESPDTATRYGVRSIPTLLFFRDGVLVDKVVGLLPRADLAALIHAHLAAVTV